MITVLFIWLGLLACIFLFIQSAMIWAILRRRHRDLNRYSVLDEEEEEEDLESEQMEKTNNHQMKSLKTNNGNTTVHLDEEDSDSQIEFEQSQPYSSKI